MVCARGELPREEPRAARELENGRRAGCRKHVDDGAFDDFDVGPPCGIVRLAAIESPRAEPPCVVFGGAGAVVSDLIGQQLPIVDGAGRRIVLGWRFVHHRFSA